MGTVNGTPGAVRMLIINHNCVEYIIMACSLRASIKHGLYMEDVMPFQSTYVAQRKFFQVLHHHWTHSYFLHHK